jgi:hypothetical protein
MGVVDVAGPVARTENVRFLLTVRGLHLPL